jgi:outer membrane protein assembly factor BamD
MLVQAYDKLGMEELRKDAERVMLANFPNSIYLKGGPRGTGWSWWRPWTW